MKRGGDPHAARLLAKWIDGLGCQEVRIRKDGESSICRVRELRAEGANTADGVSPPGDSTANGVAGKDHPDIWRLVRTTKAAAEENVFAGRTARLRLVGMVHHASQMGSHFDVSRDASLPRRSLSLVSDCGCENRHWRR